MAFKGHRRLLINRTAHRPNKSAYHSALRTHWGSILIASFKGIDKPFFIYSNYNSENNNLNLPSWSQFAKLLLTRYPSSEKWTLWKSVWQQYQACNGLQATGLIVSFDWLVPGFPPWQLGTRQNFHCLICSYLDKGLQAICWGVMSDFQKKIGRKELKWIKINTKLITGMTLAYQRLMLSPSSVHTLHLLFPGARCISYWPSVRSRCLDIGQVLFWFSKKSRSINSQKRTRPISSHLERANLSWSIKDSLHGFRKCFLRDTAGSPERARQLHHGGKREFWDRPIPAAAILFRFCTILKLEIGQMRQIIAQFLFCQQWVKYWKSRSLSILWLSEFKYPHFKQTIGLPSQAVYSINSHQFCWRGEWRTVRCGVLRFDQGIRYC